MPREKTYYFEKYIPTKGGSQKKDTPTCSIGKNGQLTISKTSIELLRENFGIRFLRMYIDRSKKAIGLQFYDSAEITGNHLKSIKPFDNKKGYQCYKIGVGKILNEFGITREQLPKKKIPIKVYEDNDEYLHLGKIYVVDLS